jgi:nucleoside-diphosphate-sugar epimerase
MSKAVQNLPPTIYGDGSQSRDFVYVSDVVRALLKAAGAETAAGRVYNVGTGKAIDINQLWDTVAKLARLNLKSQYAPPRAGDIVASVAAIDSAKTILAFEPTVSLEKGLEKTFRWYTATQTVA